MCSALGMAEEMMAKVVRWAGRIWLALAVALILFGYAGIWWTEGFYALADILSPFNFWNIIAVVIAVAPGLGLIKLAGWLERRNAAAKAESAK